MQLVSHDLNKYYVLENKLTAPGDFQINPGQSFGKVGGENLCTPTKPPKLVLVSVLKMS